MKILITGATGFLGSNIVKRLVENNYIVYATRRNTSSLDKCFQIKDRINWINTDESDWKEKIEQIKPEQLIHAAWGAVGAGERNNWEIQLNNFWLSKEYFDIAKKCNIKKVIALGSQAEYGIHDLPVNESSTQNPNEAYGAVKNFTVNYLRNLFGGSNTAWYWLRVFSVFGEAENTNWLLPTVILKLLKNESIQLTSCKQRYNYLHIDEFVDQILHVITCGKNNSGIYNICNQKSIVLEDLLLNITKLLKVSPSLLQFGAIPQRSNQNMNIEGDNSKFLRTFSIDNNSHFDLRNGLLKTIEYYKIEHL